MALAFVLGLAVVLVGFTVSLLTTPRWVARRAHRHRLWRLRDDFVDNIIDGTLPADHPAVVQTLRRIERTIYNCFALTLVGGFVFVRFTRSLSAEASREMERRSNDCSTDGLTAEQSAILRTVNERLTLLQAGSLLLGSWVGALAVLLGVFVYFRRLGAPALRQRLSAATDEVARTTSLGRMAQRAALESAALS